MIQDFISVCGAIRRQNPLVHCISNYVAMNLNANALLAVGASPLMSFSKDEMRELADRCDALYVNIGCPDSFLVDASEIAVQVVAELRKPWVLDPVGVGVTRLRTDTAMRLISVSTPAIIRGNASEIAALCGFVTADGTSIPAPKGVDGSDDSRGALEPAQLLARKTGSVVVVSGPVDFITDGSEVMTVANGSPLMRRISGAGCTASALCAAFAAVEPDYLKAAWCAMALMGVAGERAAGVCHGTGSMQPALIDELGTFNPADYALNIKTVAL